MAMLADSTPWSSTLVQAATDDAQAQSWFL